MRITNNMMSNMLLHNLNKNMFAMSRLQEQGSDGKRIHRPSDDAIGISKILKFKSDLSELDQYNSNIRDVLSWYQVSESAIVDLSSAVNRTRELAVQAANTATHSPEELEKIKAEVVALRGHIVSAGNFNYAGKYVFSGYQNDKPLLKTEMVNGKEVVTYNVDITDRDVARPQKIKYAVGSAEQIDVTTNGLEIFGVVKNDYEDYDNVTFRLEGQFDFAEDYTDGTMIINIDGKRFTVDNSKLDGTLSKEEIINVFSSAEYGKQSLSDVATVKFEQDNLVIESNKRGKVDMSLVHTTTGTALNLDDMFRIRRKPYIYALQGNFDATQDYTGNTFTVSIDGEHFEVDTTTLDGTGAVTDDVIENAFKNALYDSKPLSDVANVSCIGGVLTIENKKKFEDNIAITTDSNFKSKLIWKHEGYEYGQKIPLDHIVNVFSGMMTDSSGAEFEENVGVLQGRFDPSKNYTGDNLNITLGGVEYDVDERLLDGTKTPIDKALIVQRYRKAQVPPFPAAATAKLEDVADVYFDEHDNLVVRAKVLRKHKLEADLTGATTPLVIEVNAKEYKVLSLDQAGFEGALNSKGQRLDSVVNVSYTAPNLSLESKEFDNKTISIADINSTEHHSVNLSSTQRDTTISSASNLMKFSNTKTGRSATKAQLVGKFTLDGKQSDYRNSDLIYTVDGVKYTVDTSELTGYGFKLKPEKVLEKIRDAKDASNNKLSEVADVFFNQNGELVVKHKEYGSGKTISVDMTKKASFTGTYVNPDYRANFEAGLDAEKSTLTYDKFTFSDKFVKENEAKLKSTPIFVIYNGERHKINIDKDATLTDVDVYRKELQDAIDKTIGEDTVKVGIVGTDPNQHLTFETVNTPDGVVPEVRVEPVVSNESTLIRDIDRFISALEDYDQEEINDFLADIDVHLNRILSVRADIGAKTNRMELAVERTKDNTLSFTEALSKVEDVDMAETIMQLKNFENVYKASLSMGSKIIQPSLVDFIR